MTTRTITWFSARLESSEHFAAETVDSGHRLEGHVALPIGGQPALVRYRIDVDGDWRTRRVVATVDRGGATQRFDLECDGQGRWRNDGHEYPDLDGCTDIDLGWTPATNTLPIRRLLQAEADEQQIAVAWVRRPELDLVRGQQTYRRLGTHRWRYSSGDFAATLEVDDDGFVRRYGEDGLWVASATY